MGMNEIKRYFKASRDIEEQVDRIKDPVTREVINNMFQTLLRNVSNVEAHSEDDDDTDERVDALENEVFELKQRIYDLEV
ncbi:hypothetical protein FKV75_02665 [Weissella paramesenteroides]|uniref:hypothetical protein n=1 Tax=Weissella paramesenteroides TaxID=1249 RepID=UPI001238B1CF|nr:hypothetical protein [Weissella paramesenteroides]KAA8439194.1 hypothetical protein FKV81_08920 [Weissella paramesenteroides]KAA8440100.1 hypothetical protein FKV77_08540 [Weissella paramesenteroides]KAA8443991.1 hypothetical protein FKV75_02665 [Weissella paramesenteroides]KAA8446472.1 hypothetical protein FKV76_06275 [Weissella paramesenteroides]KAA8451541.1 hypothetical protein FKV74_02660 [Weissella paramesenteroides]